jgi:hypothetical protein
MKTPHGTLKSQKGGSNGKKMKKMLPMAQLAERFKSSTVSCDFGGFSHGRAANAPSLTHMAQVRSRAQRSFFILKIYENFCISICVLEKNGGRCHGDASPFFASR